LKKTQIKSERGNETRRMIIERSAAVFNRHGYAGTSMSELMAATGLEKGGIYRHFESKESLAAAAFDYAWEEVFSHRMRGVEMCDGPLEKLLLFVSNFVENPPRLPGGCPLLNTAVDSDDGDPVLRSRVRGALDQWRDSLIEIFREGQRNGIFRREIDSTSVAIIMISTLEGAVMMSRLEKSREPLRRVGEHLDSYLRSLQD
jgi:TetR/AcrR family transcriptional regulator, transcriptional repressor for nem operon